MSPQSDKVKSAKKPSRKRDLAAGCMLEPGDIVWVSAAKGINIDRLQDLIKSWLAT